MDAPWQMSALELARGIRQGDVSASDVLESHLERVEAVNGSVNAVVRVMADSAREAAREVDQRIAEGRPVGPLAGVPLSVKENIDVEGLPTTQGIPFLADAIAPSDAPMVERMRAAGAIPFVRTNLPDMGLRVHTDSALYGLTVNPFDAGRTAGGSSGGEGAAIASGMSPLGLGNDIGGSLRNPAYCCGIASIKPSAHRIPDASATAPTAPFLASQLMLAQGLLARRVRDLSAGFSLVAGPHVRDPYCVPAPFDGPAIVGPKKVALVPEPEGGSTDPAISDAVRRAGRALSDAGYEVEEVSPPLVHEAAEVWARWLGAELGEVKVLLEAVLSPDAMAFLNFNEERFERPTLAQTALFQQRRYEIATAWSHFQDEYPLIVGPTWTERPFTHGFDIASADQAQATVSLIRFVLPMNLLGLPVVCVPTGVTDGLPTGVQVIGARFREDLCLGAGQAIEDSLGIVTPIDPRPAGTATR